MATTNTNAVKTTRPAAEKKPPVALNVRIGEQLKRGTLGGKITGEQLDKIAELATSLKVFLSA
jgi:hypothetical protein